MTAGQHNSHIAIADLLRCYSLAEAKRRITAEVRRAPALD